jgi:hypothetical protein
MRKLLGALVLVLAAACNNDNTTSPGNGSVAGNYLLRTANGVSVPGIASQDTSGTYEVLHGRIVLRNDFSFVDSLISQLTPVGGATQTYVDVREGTYVQTGNNITFSYLNASTLQTYSVTWIDANTLAYSEPELSLIYQR